MSEQETQPQAEPTPIVPKRTIWLPVPGYGELGFKALYWANPPQRIINDMRAKGEAERQQGALLKLVLEHNGWCDPEGQPYPPASDPAFWAEIDDELGKATVRGILEAVGSDPNLQRPMRPPSESS